MKRLLALGLGLGVGTAMAADGVLEINQDCAAAGCFAGDTPGFPVQITAGGAYRLTSTLDLVGLANTVHGIVIDAPASEFVDLDLNGHAVDGGGACTGNTVTSCAGGGGGRGISVNTFGVVARIHDGAVRGMGGIGIVLVFVGSGTSVENVTVTENGDTSFALNVQTAQGGAVHLRRLNVTRNRGDGIASAITGRTFLEESVVSGNGGDGVQLPSGLTVRDCAFSNNGGFGINSSSRVALGNTSFFGNNGSDVAPQFSITTLLSMGGIVCDDGSCP